MALTTYTAATDIIKTLGTNPEDRPTLTDDTFKAKFDENSENIKVFLNAMIAELASTANGKGASQIGIEDSAGRYTATQIEAALAEIAGAGRTTETVKGLADLISTHGANTANPHAVTKTQVGLGNVTNDAQLPLSGGTLTGLLTASNGINQTLPVDWKDSTSLPSTYPVGISMFFRISYDPGWITSYGTIVTIKGYSSHPCTQLVFPYNVDEPIRTRKSLLASDTWMPWMTLDTSGIGTWLPATSGTMTATMNGTSKTITPTGACIFNASGGSEGQRCSFIIVTSGSTSYTLTWSTGFRTTGTLATGTSTGKTFVVSFIYSGTLWIETSRTVAM